MLNDKNLLTGIFLFEQVLKPLDVKTKFYNAEVSKDCPSDRMPHQTYFDVILMIAFTVIEVNWYDWIIPGKKWL